MKITTHRANLPGRIWLLSLIFLLTAAFGAFAQDVTVTGKVNDEAGTGIPGVNVVVKSSTRGTTTDAEGNFTINAPGANSTLILSSIGFTTQEIALNGRTNLTVQLATDTKSLNEVVVVGYGTQKKETVTGSVVSVKGDELVKSPAVNLANSLAGRLPGVTVVNRSGEPGADGATIRIRGANTLGNNSALIVIDGIPNRSGGLDRINPNDIESISVLKDAAAAIYGSRAANGVILITTKRGKTGKPSLSYSFNQGFANPTVIPERADAATYTGMLNDLDIYGLPVAEWAAANEAYKTTGSYTRPDGTVRKAPFTPEDMEKYRDGSDPWGHPDTDWFGATFKNNSPQSRHNVQLTGGTESLKYLASLGYQNQDGYYINSATGYKQYDIRINLDATINKYVKVNMGILGRREARSYPTRSAGAIFRMLNRGKPQEPAYWPDGRPGPDIENGENPVVITTDLSGYDKNNQDYVQTNGSLEIKIPGVEGLKFTGTAAIDTRSLLRKTWQIPWTLYQRGSGFEADGTTPVLVPAVRGPAEPNLRLENSNQLNILLGGVASYDKVIGNHTFNVLAGMNRETISGDNFNAYRRFFISPALDQLFAGGDLQKDNGGGAFNTARINYFGRVGYNYKEKYIAEFLWRYDGSDIFPPATRYGFFPGIMLGWVVSEEGFWKNNVPAVNFFKIRGSVGQLGNDQVYIPNTTTLATYQYLSTYGFRSYIIGGNETKTLFEARVPNPNITWEVATNSNIGIDAQLFNGKVTVELDAFSNHRTNILYFRNASVPESTGLNLPSENIGEVKNRGWEFNIGYRNAIKDFKYNVGINGGYAQNKIIFWDEAPGAPDWQRSTGKPINTGVFYQYDGVFKDQAEIAENTLDYSAIVNQLRPGDMKYKDIGGRDQNGNFVFGPDGKINADDRIREKFTNLPLFQGGINLGAQYKNFDLTVLFQGAAGAKQYVSTGESGNIGNFLQEVADNRWTIDNPSSVHPRIANRSDQYYSNGNTYWLQSTDYIRLKNMEIGYSLPSEIISKVGLSQFRLYFNGLNLLTFSKMKAYDPEAANDTGYYYPQQKVVNFGLTATF
ncbi:SusC/RagA family TonB-linked outer membrane protein [Persicitalea jodogahamensis]|uniref:SusC/RagA family TonB-linked outer membrane protein n=1 Tax=Persicitalea jodogahamensis TaxID=402147 RepID=A0A8J3G8N0_9BACT|nr:TonB-dependent receptor [Persicitalea jodogahamensis]GHB60141.1 SusC/RagA family TonB-linked outer membrane protein [Persicitalea jodogahamensis]